MKKIKYTGIFVMLMAVLFFASCADVTNTIAAENQPQVIENQDTEKKESSGYAVRFSVKDIKELTDEVPFTAGSRTVYPLVSLNDLKDLIVEAGRSGYGTEKTFGPYKNISELRNAEIILPYDAADENWNFTLYAYAGKICYRALVEDVYLELTDDESPAIEIDFVLSLYTYYSSDGKGSFAYTLNYASDPSAPAVDRVLATFTHGNGYELEDMTFEGSALDSKRITISAESIPDGRYDANISFYAGNILAAYWMEKIYVYDGMTSSKEQNISLKKFVRYTYVMNDNNDPTLEFAGQEYLKKTQELPRPSRADYLFIDWYKDSALTEVFTPSSETGIQQTVYAKWGDKYITTSFAAAASVIEAARGGSVDNPIVLTLTGSYSSESLEDIKESLRAQTESYFVLDLSNVTGLTELEDYSFYQCDKVSGLVLPSSITSIGYAAFYATSLKTLAIPDAVTLIGGAAFADCNRLESVSFGQNSSLETIGNEAFSGCLLFSQVTIPDSVTSIGDYAFYITSLEEITIPDSVTTIGSYAFGDCTSLAHVTIGSGLEEIGIGAFVNCPIESFVIDPSASVSLENGILFNADKTEIISIVDSEITTITMPASLESFPLSEIQNLRNLTSITVLEGNPNYSSADGVLFTADGASLIYCPRAKTGSYTIPSTVTTIESNAFENSSLTSIVTDKTWLSISNDGAAMTLGNTPKYYFIENFSGNEWNECDESEIIEVSIYDSENTDLIAGNWTVTDKDSDSEYNGVLYKLTTEIGKEYRINWYDGHSSSCTNVPDDFEDTDSKIYVYNSSFSKIGYIDDEEPVDFTAESTTTYLMVGAYSSGKCKCAFRVWKIAD